MIEEIQLLTDLIVTATETSGSAGPARDRRRHAPSVNRQGSARSVWAAGTSRNLPDCSHDYVVAPRAATGLRSTGGSTCGSGSRLLRVGGPSSPLWPWSSGAWPTSETPTCAEARADSPVPTVTLAPHRHPPPRRSPSHGSRHPLAASPCCQDLGAGTCDGQFGHRV